MRGCETATTWDPSGSRKGGAPHEARRPDVAVDATLVAEAVGEASLAEQFVKLVLVRRRNLAANLGYASIDVRGGLSFSGDGYADSSEECIRQFEGRGLGYVEAVDEAVADQIKVAGDSRACFAAVRTQPREYLRGVAVSFEDVPGRRVLGKRLLQSLHLVGPTRGHHGRTAHQSQQLGRWQARPVPNVCKEVSGRQHGTSGEAHVLCDHRRMVVATACQIGDQLGVREGVWIHGLQLPVFRNGDRFAVRVPVEKLLSPKLVRKDLLGTREALGDLRGRHRQHLIVAEAVHVAGLETVDKQPVATGKNVGPSL